MTNDNPWADYLDKLRQLEKQVKLVSFWTNETVKATEEVCKQAEEVVRNVKDYLARVKGGEV